MRRDASILSVLINSGRGTTAITIGVVSLRIADHPLKTGTAMPRCLPNHGYSLQRARSLVSKLQSSVATDRKLETAAWQ